MPRTIPLLASLALLPACALAAAPPDCGYSDLQNLHNVRDQQMAMLSLPPDFLSRYPPGSQERSFDTIQRVFSAAGPRVSAAYEQARRGNPELRGVFKFAIALDAQGRVQALETISRSSPAPQLEKALADILRSLDFGPTCGDGYYLFAYPIQLGSE